jgi:hypothetical protein
MLHLPSCQNECAKEPCRPRERTARVDVIPLAAPPRPVASRSVESVPIVVTPPSYPFVQTALIDGREDGTCCSDKEAVLYRMRLTAARIGCDVLVIYSGNDVTYSTFHPAGAFSYTSNSTYEGYRAACGVYYGVAGVPRSFAPSR